MSGKGKIFPAPSGFGVLGGFSDKKAVDNPQGFSAPKGFPTPQNFKGGFPASTGFPAPKGFPAPQGFPNVTADVNVKKVENVIQETSPVVETSIELEQGTPKEGTPPKNVKFFEGVSKLNKTDTIHAWNEFGGDKTAVFEADGSAYITRIIERESKKSGVYFKLVEKLTRDIDGYGVVSWRIDLGAVVRRKPPKAKFDESWKESILEKVRAVVADGVPVAAASKALAEELGVSFSTMRANLWVADKWARGESSTFLPHRTMIRPIFELLCELGKKDAALSSLSAYCTEVSKPSEYVLAVLNEYR